MGFVFVFCFLIFFFVDVTQITVIHELVCHAGPLYFCGCEKLPIHIPSDSQLHVNAELVPSLELFQTNLRGHYYKLDLIT